MRRFLDWGYQKLNERHPERAMAMFQGAIGGIFGGLMEEAKKLEQAGALPEQTGRHHIEDKKRA